MKNLFLRSSFLALTTLAGSFAYTGHAQTNIVQANPKHYVFAHYMLAFGSTTEFYKQEIELAQRSGIDGFALNAGDWLGTDGTPGKYVESATKMFQAAKELNSGFKLFFSPDLATLQNLSVNISDMVSRFKDHPNQLKRDGKVVVSGWAGTPASYAEAINKIKAGGTDVFFIPFVANSKYSFNWSPETVSNFYEGQPHMDGVFFFGADGTFSEIIRTNSIGTRISHERGKLFMAGISPAFNSPNLRDFRGFRGYDEMWKGIINDNADWVEIVTWNDYNEDSNMMPFRWPAEAGKNHTSRDDAFLELTKYYSDWYKTGVSPAIKQDKLYYTYRNRSKHLTKGWNPTKKEWYDITRGEGTVDQIHDDVEDNIYVTTALTAPADLTIAIGTTSKTFAMPAGIGHVSIPLQPGVPRFTIQRAKKTVINIWGRKLIIAKETEENSPAGYHLQNRTWVGSAVAGNATRLEAESGKLSAGATIVKVGAAITVQNLEKDGSGFSIPVKNLKTGTYNVRIVYSNPAATEARLTLYADGPPRAQGESGYFLPAFLPPTPKGQLRTTSFFWSLYNNTTELKLEWTLGREWGQLTPINDDKGSVLIDAIELIPVAPVETPAIRDAATPLLVGIPGGSFQMGSKNGSPDEAPVHPVTLSPFAIGQTEITNEQYEKFDPAHRNVRDEFSWRDSDPVIYVSWNDAMKYCNWLSKQQNLTPAYDEGNGKLDISANGYRMPSEAQWEYVAAGRNENRIYPWGNKAPNAALGNFLLSVTGGDSLPVNFIGYGTRAVGSFPEGATRDGVLDMAGNVAEWCGDYYAPYPTTTGQADPVVQTPSNYRVIRGNSWGYYGRSARVSDREFNSAGYPGYIYLGFRVALPQAGWQKLVK